jgi:DNA-binding Lrp family transcriptional regulator
MGERTTFTEEFKVTSEELVSRVRRLMDEGNVRRIKVKQDDKVILDIPLTVGVVGTLLAPTLAALGALAALLSEMTIEVERIA